MFLSSLIVVAFLLAEQARAVVEALVQMREWERAKPSFFSFVSFAMQLLVHMVASSAASFRMGWLRFCGKQANPNSDRKASEQMDQTGVH